jgi:hypothetical protein
MVSLIGATVLVLGLAVSAGGWFLLQSLAPARSFGWAFAIPAGTLSLLAGLGLLFSGRRLRKSGTAHRHEVQLEAVKALVQHRRGPISAADAASALQLPEADVDQLLTRLAREQATAVTLDVDARGHVVYDFDGEERRWRVLEETAEAEAEGSEAQAARKRGAP